MHHYTCLCREEYRFVVAEFRCSCGFRAVWGRCWVWSGQARIRVNAVGGNRPQPVRACSKRSAAAKSTNTNAWKIVARVAVLHSKWQGGAHDHLRPSRWGWGFPVISASEVRNLASVDVSSFFARGTVKVRFVGQLLSIVRCGN